MNRIELKLLLGEQYKYESFYSEEEVAQFLQRSPRQFADRVVSSLSAGCVRIDALLYRSRDTLKLGYDVFVKDRPESSDWICYDSPDDKVSLKEEDMLSVLNRIVSENGLSYTECNFELLEGKEVKLKM